LIEICPSRLHSFLLFWGYTFCYAVRTLLSSGLNNEFYYWFLFHFVKSIYLSIKSTWASYFPNPKIS
jgi:hypothetical protein